MSAFNIYATDSIYGNSIIDSSEIELVKDVKSKMMIKKSYWGIYEVIKIVDLAEGYSEIFLIGNKFESIYKPTIWVSNNQKYLDLAGDTKIKGEIYSGLNIFYSRVNSDYYKGEQIEKERIKKSNEVMPTILNDIKEKVNKTFENINNNSFIESVRNYDNSFNNNTIVIRSNPKLNATYIGNLIIVGKEIQIERSAKLEGVIIVANKVIIKQGCSVECQIFATDSVIVEKHVKMRYPSGIYLRAEHSKNPGIIIKDSANIKGYIVADIMGQPPSIKAVYSQSDKSKVYGLLYVNGVAQLQGKIRGAAYLKESYYFSKQGYYSNILYNVHLERDTLINYPILMKANYNREVIKWLN
ncbi:hypothetical protein SDC9_47244 [bioreactor metagenome]|uniref:Uncharacterized protein n=1 Tax=bioreactor metagenome TaxID=1076179 RepID=A0A644WBV3_9ZZZZ